VRIIMIDWNKSFPIASLSREDLKYAGFTKADIALITDEDMVSLAGRLEDLYRDNQFEIDLETAASLLLSCRKEEENAENKADA
jgi:hypothetical protein